MYDARKLSPPFAWISKIPQEDREWARDYLRGKGAYVPTDAFEKNTVVTLFLEAAQAQIVDLQLRNAWRQRRARRKLVGKKAYNFTLTNKSKKELDKLAQDMNKSITDTLEHLLRDENELRADRKIVEKEVRRIDEKNRRLKDTEDAITVLRSAENVLALQTMKLALAQIQLENSLSQHVPQDALEDQVLTRFSDLWQAAKNSMGILSQGLSPQAPESLWRKVMNKPQQVTPRAETFDV